MTIWGTFSVGAVGAVSVVGVVSVVSVVSDSVVGVTATGVLAVTGEKPKSLFFCPRSLVPTSSNGWPRAHVVLSVIKC
jgi:hypothetical protein